MDSPESLQQHLAAIVENSDDAIITKDLASIILTWNGGAEKLFGYTADEAVGQPITMLFPEDRVDEEAGFITRLRRGERIANFETVRKRKDGSLVPISLTVSPVRDSDGNVVGASKIARDITPQQRIAEQQRLLLSEMRHRVGNAFAVAGGLLSIAAREAASAAELAATMRQRLNVLASVHSMAVSDPSGDKPIGTDLPGLTSAILEPFGDKEWTRIELPDLPVCSSAMTPLSLVLFELATNAVKYGGLAEGGQGVVVSGRVLGDRLVMRWEEHQASVPASHEGDGTGFGTRMIQSTVGSSLGGSFSRDFGREGMTATLDLDLETVTGGASTTASTETIAAPGVSAE